MEILHIKLWKEKMEKSEIRELLKLKGREQEKLFEKARNIRDQNFNYYAFIRAIIEPSNNCSNHCKYCAMQNSSNISRYRMNVNEIISIADEMNKKGISVFSLETGEDEIIIPNIIEAVKKMKEKSYWILGAFGDLEKKDYSKLKEAGMDAYLLKFETSDEKNYSSLRPKTKLKTRLNNIEILNDLGFKLTTGNIVGLPNQTIDSLINDILLTKMINPFSATVSPFIPSIGTSLENSSYGDIDLTLNTIAIYRILMPKIHIPALCALNFYEDRNQFASLNAGASDVLINTTPYNSKSKDFAIYSTKKQIVQLEAALKIIYDSNLKFNININSSLE